MYSYVPEDIALPFARWREAFNSDKKSIITSERPIRHLAQSCFDEAAEQLEKDGDKHGARVLQRFTGYGTPVIRWC